ncbi:uncharacterized protein METZ01_LOCUS24994 [marine metagenome]|uniref:Uncharacterized protein n=1 Tax=marine metagenome TaxID=408172 RepID=A0A381PZ58_9ZZZZ
MRLRVELSLLQIRHEHFRDGSLDSPKIMQKTDQYKKFSAEI